MPVTANARASSAAASDSPRPRDTPVTIAAFIGTSVQTLDRSSKAAETSAVRAERQHDDHCDQDGDAEQRELHPALRILALDRTSDAVHDCLKATRSEIVGQQPDRREYG